MRTIPLTQGQLAIVDDEDYPNLLTHKWQAQWDRNTFYARKTVKINGIKKTFSLHRVIMNAQPGQIIDHINGNGLDNRRQNLRFCDTSQNSANRGKVKKGASSKFKGVSKLHITVRNKRKSGKIVEYKYVKFSAQIRFRNKGVTIGVYHTEIEAAIAYNNKAVELHKEFARLNIIPCEV